MFSGYSSDGSNSLMRDKSQFPFETNPFNLDGSSFIDDSELIGMIDSEFVIDTTEISGPAINGGPMESPNYQFNQAETSEASFQTEAECGKSKPTPAQRENKRKCDINYRQKLKGKMGVLQGLVRGCSKVKGKEAMLDEIINYVQSLQRQVEGLRLNSAIEEKAHELIAENKHLKEENERLNAENTALKEKIGLLPSSGKQVEHQSLSLQDHHGSYSEAVDKIRSLELQQASFISLVLMQLQENILEVNGVKPVSGLDALLNATEAPRDTCLQVQEISLNKRKRSVQDAEFDQAKGGQPLNKARKDSVENHEKGEDETIPQIGQTKTSHCYNVRIETIKEKERILQELVPGCSKLTGAEALDEIINYIQSLQRQVEFLSMKLSEFHPISNGDAAVTDILFKLEADDGSKVKLSDFSGLDGERITIGKYSFPLSLHPIIKNIIDVYGDVSATSKMNPTIAEAIYIMFCACVKEMSDLRLEHVTEGLILKWRDVIKDALCMNFKVEFAMEHLKKIACAYIGRMEHSKILKLEAQLSATKEEHSKILKRSKVFMDAAEDFNDKPVSSGMFVSTRGVKQTLEGANNSSST
ncbi:uncharacterized protein LOC120219409 [Hibiscus syriacus]|uniref:uncharacterized protein LOC120219409 n=1 Tax=Hibiscus syriacus TaxID=106335 RepID=UPI001920C4C0|nr:uncharacterized protein LOC120219409 [Hibiscus syriacus]